MVQAPLATETAIAAALASPSSKPALVVPLAKTASSSQRSAPRARDDASTLPTSAAGGPSLTTFAIVIAALGALAGCSFALVRRQRAYPRRVAKHSRRGLKQQRSDWPA